jgi:peroxiredoxin Q/BCP
MLQPRYRITTEVVTRMAASNVAGRPKDSVMRLRVLTETARAVAIGVTNFALGRGVGTPIVLRAGDPAPGFTLPASDGHQYSLSEFLGRKNVVIAWFPKAFTGGCTAECRSLGANSAILNGPNVQFFAASVDSAETNAEFGAALDLGYPILSDASRDVARAYGVLGASGFASRWTFFIGLDGRVLDVDRSVRTVSHGADVLARLTALGIS